MILNTHTEKAHHNINLANSNEFYAQQRCPENLISLKTTGIFNLVHYRHLLSAHLTTYEVDQFRR